MPLTIAGKAAEVARTAGLLGRRSKKRDSYEARDEVWAVFDRDEFPDYNEALSLCRDNGIQVARSNPCFEVWMILHLQEYDRDEHRHQTQKLFGDLCPDYDREKRKTTDCLDLVKNIDYAERRALQQLNRRDAEGGTLNPPSTTVFRLTRKLRGLDPLEGTDEQRSRQ